MCAEKEKTIKERNNFLINPGLNIAIFLACIGAAIGAIGLGSANPDETGNLSPAGKQRAVVGEVGMGISAVGLAWTILIKKHNDNLEKKKQ
jgi:hypothetical protein